MSVLKEGDEVIALKKVIIVGDKNVTERTTIGKSYKVIEVWHLGFNYYDFKIIDDTGYGLKFSQNYINSKKYCCFKVLNWERVEKIKSLL